MKTEIVKLVAYAIEIIVNLAIIIYLLKNRNNKK